MARMGIGPVYVLVYPELIHADIPAAMQRWLRHELDRLPAFLKDRYEPFCHVFVFAAAAIINPDGSWTLQFDVGARTVWVNGKTLIDAWHDANNCIPQTVVSILNGEEK